LTESDDTLVGRARRGDPGAFEVLLRRYFRASYLVAMAQLGEPAEAEDACQDAFVKAWEQLEQCRDGARFGAWLLRIVRNIAQNRRDYLRVRRTESLEDDAAVYSRASAEGELERQELAFALRAALATLPPVQREIVLMHDLEDWPHARIAALLEISEVMSRRHLSDARKQLRALLRGRASEEARND
jgi:RNA polymerase sigma-70 factor (ECF subfamily)